MATLGKYYFRTPIILLVFSFVALSQPADDNKPPCKVCQDMTLNFMKGLKKTAMSNFGGGNTDWEQKHLGSYAFSETRFIEIQENLCKSTEKECHKMLEEHEEVLERWWFHEYKKGVNLNEYFCVKFLKVCCSNGTYGENCDECVGGKDRPCWGNGKCHGDGSRGGTGQCECNDGYRGDLCNECTGPYYEEFSNKTHIVCTKCDAACDTSCWEKGTAGCDDCKKGWEHREDEGCFDVNECEQNSANCTATQYCSNTIGSYKCLSCHHSCGSCTGAGGDKCTECGTTYYRAEDDTCKACDESCSSCTAEGSEACTDCKTGYQRNTENNACDDIDECSAKTPICLESQFCTNRPGTHKCTECHKACKTCTAETFKNCIVCAKGYKKDEKGHCRDINECEPEEGEENPCTGEYELCVNMVGSYVCNCQPEYEKKNGKCVKSKTKGKKQKKDKKKKKHSVDSKPIEEMSQEEQDAAIKELMDDDSINKKVVDPRKPPQRKKPKPAKDSEATAAGEEEEKQQTDEAGAAPDDSSTPEQETAKPQKEEL